MESRGEVSTRACRIRFLLLALFLAMLRTLKPSLDDIKRVDDKR